MPLGGNVSNLSARTPGKFGRLGAKFPAGLRTLDHYVAGDLPAAPASVPVPAFPNWDVLGNDQYGDCGVAGLTHLMEAASVDAAVTGETWPTADQVVQYYLAYTGGQDTGVVLSDFLAYVRQQGFLGHTVTAYAPVDVHDVPTFTSALYLYDAVYCGITVTQAMMDAFQTGQPWTADVVAGEPIGGHCVPAVAYDDNGLTVITWGQPQVITWPAWHAISSEAWAVIPGELAKGDGHGVDLAVLTADLDKLDVPAPAPAEHPGLLGELAALVHEAEAIGVQDWDAVVAFIKRHGL